MPPAARQIATMSLMSDPRLAFITLAHGSPDPEWKRTIERVARRASQALGGARVEPAFLKDCAPDLETTAALLAAEGRREIVVAPLFLGAGAHAAKDFPRLEAKLQRRFPGVVFRWTPAFGQWEEAVDALATALAARFTALGGGR